MSGARRFLSKMFAVTMLLVAGALFMAAGYLVGMLTDTSRYHWDQATDLYSLVDAQKPLSLDHESADDANGSEDVLSGDVSEEELNQM